MKLTQFARIIECFDHQVQFKIYTVGSNISSHILITYLVLYIFPLYLLSPL